MIHIYKPTKLGPQKLKLSEVLLATQSNLVTIRYNGRLFEYFGVWFSNPLVKLDHPRHSTPANVDISRYYWGGLSDTMLHRSLRYMLSMCSQYGLLLHHRRSIKEILLPWTYKPLVVVPKNSTIEIDDSLDFTDNPQPKKASIVSVTI